MENNKKINYGVLYTNIYDRAVEELGTDAAILLSRLIRFSQFEKVKNNSFHLKDTTIEEWLGWSRRRFQNARQVLEDNNLISRKRGFNKGNNGKAMASLYTLNMNEIQTLFKKPSRFTKRSQENISLSKNSIIMPNFVCNVECKVEVMQQPQAHFDEDADNSIFYEEMDKSVFVPSYDVKISNVIEMK